MPDDDTEATRRRLTDETNAMLAIGRALDGLNQQARVRVLRWVEDRYIMQDVNDD
jgi:hypothetical protein